MRPDSRLRLPRQGKGVPGWKACRKGVSLQVSLRGRFQKEVVYPPQWRCPPKTDRLLRRRHLTGGEEVKPKKMVQSNKIELVERVTETLKKSQSIVLSDFKGMTVAQLTGLRSQLREQSVEMRVIKNRLIKRALSEAGYDNLDEFLVGNTAVSFGIKDAAAPAKILTEYAKKNDKFIIKGGLLEGKRLDLNGVKSLATMPSRKELLSIMAGDMKQPAVKLATAFQAGLLKVAYAMQALAKKQEGMSESAA